MFWSIVLIEQHGQTQSQLFMSEMRFSKIKMYYRKTIIPKIMGFYIHFDVESIEHTRVATTFSTLERRSKVVYV